MDCLPGVGGGGEGCRADLAVLGLGRGLLDTSTFRAEVSQTTEREEPTGCIRFDMVKAFAAATA